MPKIIYTQTKSGMEYAKWPGISRRIEVNKGGITRMETRKIGQMQLGFVIDKEHLIFFKETMGLYQFDPETQFCKELHVSDLPEYREKLDEIRKERHVNVLFGGSYFLDSLINGINYQIVLDSLQHKNRDRFYTMLQYYTLTNGPASGAMSWYEHNYAKFLYPLANPASQRVSEFLADVGSDENLRTFFLAHIKYVLKSTDEELCVLVDSTGMPNKCNLPVTCVSNHDGEISIGYRVIVVVQKSTGIPVFFQLIKGNIVDTNTITNIMDNLRNLGYKVTYSIGDAAYSCPANIERLVLAGIDFLTRLNPAYDHFKTALEENIEYLNDVESAIWFNGRPVIVHKIKTVVARDNVSGEDKEGYIYLCRDISAQYSKGAHLMNSKRLAQMSLEEVNKELEKFGIFALLSTKDIPAHQVLKEYYMRQGIEQFFDYEKNYSNALPVRVHSLETLKGHLLMGFISTFLVILIKNKMKIMDSPYAVVPSTLRDEMGDTPYVELNTQQGIELMVRQYKTEQNGSGEAKDEERMTALSKVSPSTVFTDLQFLVANVYDDEIIPDTPDATANMYFKAFHIDVPRLIKREGNGVQSPTYHDGQGNRCTRRLVFSRRSSLTHEQLEERKKKGELKKLMTEAEKQGYSLVPNTSKKEEVDNPKQDAEQEKESVQDHQTDTSSSDKTFDLPDIPAARLDSKGEFKQTFEFNKQIGCEAESVNTINSNMVPPSGQGNPTVNKEGISSTYEEEMDETPLMQLPPPLAECLGNQSQKRNRKGAGKGKRQAVNTASPQPESDDSAIRSDYGESGDAVEQPVKSETKRSKGSNRGKGKDQESSSTKAEASGDP